MTQHQVILAVSLTMASLASLPLADARTFYRFKALAGIADARTSTGIAINDSNTATGSVVLKSGSSHAYKTDEDDNMVDLGTPAGMNQSYGQAINSIGQIAGYSEQNVRGIQQAFITDGNGTFADLGSLGGTKNQPFGINDAGQVTGLASTAVSSSNFHAFLGKPNKTMVDLGTLGTNLSGGFAINASGIVTGAIAVATATKSFITDENGQNMRELLPDLPESAGMAINASGQVAGYFRSSPSAKTNAFVTDSNGQNMLAIQGLNGLESYADGINDDGRVVGHYAEQGSIVANKGFITDSGGKATPLAKLMRAPIPSSCNPLQPHDINNNDWIIGTCGPNFQNYAFLLIPEDISSVPVNRENSFKLSETQQDFLSCDADKKCTVINAATGTHALGMKFSASTLSSHGIDLTQLQTTTPIAISIGNFSFSGTLDSADPDKQQLTPTSLPASWTTKHTECKKYAADNSCTKSATIIDDVVKISTDRKHNLTITLKGKRSFSNNNKFGQQLGADLCPSNPPGISQIIDNALVSIDSQPLPMAINIDCKLKSTSKTIRQTQTSFVLNSLSLKASLINDP